MNKQINILITSVGRRTQLLSYFKQELKGIGSLIAADCNYMSPALYVADRKYIVPKVTEPNYMDEIMSICLKEDISAVLTLIDPEISLLAKHKEEFVKAGVYPIVSSYGTCNKCLDKYEMYEFCIQNGFRCGKTYSALTDFKAALKRGEINFPVFVKPRKGSASIGINKVNSITELEYLFLENDSLLIQEFLDGQEYGVDAYVDLITNEVVSVFAKKKLAMRSGETDKSVSFKDPKLFQLVEDFIKKLGIRAQTDIDIFEVKGDYYISEVNPRFGGGYVMAHECGCNFVKNIINNLLDLPNPPDIGNYEDHILLMKHDALLRIDVRQANGVKFINYLK